MPETKSKQKTQLECVVYTDGAASGNPGPAGWGVVAVFPNGTVQEWGEFVPNATNNQMEISSAVEALRRLRKIEGIKIQICSDSTYLLRGITQWVHGWAKRQWKTQEGAEVANRDLWEELSALARGLGKNVQWFYVPGHSEVAGNERADEIAVSLSKRKSIHLKNGEVSDIEYGLPEEAKPASKLPAPGTSSQKKKAIGYLSLVGRTVAKHTTWAECEARVKGVSGAKFKKILSAEDESEILAAWGVSPGQILK